MEPSKPPRVFISYSWESEDHKSWVRYLGERLCAAGIEARLDQWFVQPGQSFTAFMEEEVEEADFVIAVCTPSYARKSNNRQGGVGYEQQIVSGRLMSGTARSKFIPILRKGDYESGPDCAIPSHFLGISWSDFRDDAAFEESLEDLIRVIFSKPGFAPPPLGARPSLETITATTPSRVEVCWKAYSDKDHDRAIADYTKVIEIAPWNPDAYYARGSAYSAKDDHDRALADYIKATNIEVCDAAAYTVCEDPCSDEHWDRAIADCTEVIELKPDTAHIYLGRGYAYFAKGDNDRAIADYTKAIELEPDDVRFYCARGYAYFEKGDNDRAIADHTKAIELKPDAASAYVGRGDAYFAEGDNDRAITDHTKAIEIGRCEASAYVGRGLAYAAKGDKARALADFRTVRKLPNTPDDRERVLRALRRLATE